MIKLVTDETNNIVYTTWNLKINRDARSKKLKSGVVKNYCSYFTTFPQELYDFFDIKDDTIYLVKEDLSTEKIIITDVEPELPACYFKVKLITRRKNNKNRIPTTTFTLSKKIFNNRADAQEVRFILNPKVCDKYRNKTGLVSIEIH